MPIIETSRLIKSDALRRNANAVAFHYSDIESSIEERCAEHLQAAQARAHQLLLDAEADAEQVRTKAWQLGHQTGTLQAESDFEARVEAEVERRLEERLRHLVAPLRDATAQLLEDREQMLLQWELGAVRLSLAVAERVLRRELTQHPAAPRELIAEVVQLARGAVSITLRLHPLDVQDLETHLSDWQQFVSGQTSFTVIADPGITRGGCLLETPDGEIDARIETQLARIANELTADT